MTGGGGGRVTGHAFASAVTVFAVLATLLVAAGLFSWPTSPGRNRAGQ